MNDRMLQYIENLYHNIKTTIDSFWLSFITTQMNRLCDKFQIFAEPFQKCFLKLKRLFFAATETVGTRRPWFPVSRMPRDRELTERGQQVDALASSADSGTLPNHSSIGGGGRLRNQFVRRPHGTRRRAQSAHRPSTDNSVDVVKVIESSMRTPRPVHRLLVVSTVQFLFYSRFLLFFITVSETAGEVLCLVLCVCFFVNMFVGLYLCQRDYGKTVAAVVS